MNLDGAADRFNDASKFDKGSITGPLDHAPVMHCDRRVDKIAPKRPQPRQRAIFVGPREPTKAHYVSRQNCRDFPSLGHSDRSPWVGQTSTTLRFARQAVYRGSVVRVG